MGPPGGFYRIAGAGEPKVHLVLDFFLGPFPHPRRGGALLSEGKNTDISRVTISGTQLAVMLGITDRQVRNLEAEGVVIKQDRGKYVMLDSIKGYIAWLKTSKDLEKKEPNYDLEAVRAKHESLKIQKTEIDLKVIKGQLHAANDVEHVMMNMLAFFKAKILAMPSKLAPTLTLMTSTQDISDRIEDECMLALNELADYDPSLFFEGAEDSEDGED